MKHLVPFALALALAGCGDNPAGRIARAEKAFAAHDYRSAQIDLAAALQAEPANPAALELAARNHLAQGDGVAAQAALDKLAALGRSPADLPLLAGEAALLRGRGEEALAAVGDIAVAEAHRIRALAKLALGDEEGAAKAFATGIQAVGDRTRLYADYGRFQLQKGDLAASTELAGKAAQSGPKQLDALLIGAQVAAAKGDLGRALATYETAIEAYPGNLAALTGKAGVLGDLGRKQELAALVDTVGKSMPGDPAVAYLQARVAAESGDWRKVRAILQPLEGSLEGRDDAALLYAQAQLGLGQAQQARARLEPIVRRSPGHTLAALLLARAQLAGGDAKGAVATLRARAARPEAPPEVLALMAKATRAAGDPGAAEYASRAARPTPQSLAAELARGDAALKTGNWQAAATAYRRILAQTDGKNVLVLNNYAYAQQQLGNTREALDLALRALKLAPDNPSVMDTAGWLLATSGGDRNRALDLLREAARRAPQNKTIAAHLAKVEQG